MVENGNISYERCAYESVDDGSPSWVTSQKSTDNKIQAANVWQFVSIK